MNSDFIVRGDNLPVLTQLTVSQATGLDSPRALIWGIDLATAGSRHAAQKQLRRECRDVAQASAAQPNLTHLFIVYTHGAAMAEGSCLTSAAQSAARLHAELERSRGRFVEVVLIDATGWENGEALRDRILQTVNAPAGVAGDVALGWHAIADASIHQAAMQQLC